jgi:hypothetical protein
MNSPLEKFVSEHREEFDAEEPGQQIWDKIQLGLDPGKKKATPVIRLNRAWWSAAAAVILILTGGIWYAMSNHSSKTPSDLASQTPPAGTQPSNTQPSTETQSAAGNQATTARSSIDTALKNSSTLPARRGNQGTEPDRLAEVPRKEDPADKAKEQESLVNEEMYHYARLVELKHKQLKSIEKDEPLLYRQFASDVNKLDSTYHLLEKQLPNNPNQEQLLEAMLQNLQLQMGLLNHQLDIIKQINHSKKTAYEKAYKTI